MAQFNLGDIFYKAFGYEPNVTDADSIKLEQRKEISSLGQQYRAKDLDGTEYFLPVTINDVLIPFAVLGMTWKKTIVSTAMPERGGSVKELISIDDYEFTLKGILVDKNNDFPDDQVMNLHNLFLKGESLVMRSVLSDIVLKGMGDDPDGHKVVIKEIKWPEVSGIEHAKPFEMQLESDMIFDLEIK